MIENEILKKWREEASTSRLILEHENNIRIIELIDEILEAKKLAILKYEQEYY